MKSTNESPTKAQPAPEAERPGTGDSLKIHLSFKAIDHEGNTTLGRGMSCGSSGKTSAPWPIKRLAPS
jgi:hypothetical protein